VDGHNRQSISDWGLARYAFRILAIGAGYHRHFVHRAFKTNRRFAILRGRCVANVGATWRALVAPAPTPRVTSIRRRREGSSTPIGWLSMPEHDDTDYDVLRDLAQYPELRWLNRSHHQTPGTKQL